MARRRRNAIAQKFAKMRGLPPEEKQLMQRIGNLMDSALNNRQATNPFENARQITTRDIYPPTGILVKKGIKSIKILWDATPSNALLRYEVTFDNLTTGERTVKTTFTNEVIFKATKGTYVARIVSISRNNSTSLVKTIQFNAGDEVMQLEGGKNGPLKLGTLVQDDIQHISGYSIYVWGSVVLDKYVLANAVNPTITFRLWKADGPDGVFGDATLQETIELYAATESASNLDATSRGGLISRPTVYTKGSTGTQAGKAIPIVRSGSFETSQSVMFSPIAVLTADDKETFTYFLQAINRETDADEVNLSITMWTGADGQGDAVPGDPFTPAPAYVFPHKNSFHSQIVGWTDASLNPALDSRSMWASVPQSLNLLGNQHTIAMWFRPDNLSARDLVEGRDEAAPSGGTIQLLSRVAIDPPNGTKAGANRWGITIQGLSDLPSGFFHALDIKYGDFTGGVSPFKLASWARRSSHVTGTDEDISAGLFSWGGAPTASAANNDGWYFLVICFEGGDFTNSSPSKLRVYMNSVSHPIGGAPAMVLLSPTGVDKFEQSIEQDDTDSMSYSIGDTFTDGGGNIAGNMSNGLFNGGLRTPVNNSFVQYHQLGMWNVALDRSTAAGSDSSLGGLVPVGLQNAGAQGEFVASSPIDYLFNAGFGTLVDWRIPSPLVNDPSSITGVSRVYFHNENLCHLIQFGAVEQAMSTGYPGRDTGNHYFNGDMNFTGVTPEGRYRARFNYTGDPPGEPATADNTGNHYTDNTTIADILSPDGTNGTTQSDKAYPGQNL